jgi:transcriptional regulator with XRE-family HTH domain
MTIGERITHLRLRKGILTQAELARLAGVPLSTLSYVERGLRDGAGLSVATAQRLAKALGVTLDYLTGMYAEDDDVPR